LFLAFLLLLILVTSVTAQGTHLRGTVWVSPTELAALEELTAMYQETHPDVTVEWINITGGGPYGRDKLQTMLAGGDIPDFMMLNTGQFEALAARNQLLPLDDLVASSGLDLGIYWPQAITGSSYNGTLYALPRDMSNVILYYNKDMFDAAGVAYPTVEWTWDDLLAAAQKMTLDTNGDGQIDQWGVGIDRDVWQWDGWVIANGGQTLSADRSECMFTDPKTVEALKYWFSLLTEHQVAPPPGALPDQGWSGDQFVVQAVAMVTMGPWFRPGLVNMEDTEKFNWDVAYPPRSPNTGEHGSDVYTDQWAIAAGSQLPAETFDFVSFLTSEAGQTRWLELLGSRSISPVQSVAQSEAWLHYGGSSGEIILDSLSFSYPPPVNFANAPEAENIWDQELALVVAGEESVEDAVANICPQLDPILPEPAAS
jgi:multiple sugar transport system substrate-binding protein